MVFMKSRLLQSRHMSFLSVLFLFKNSSWCVVIHCGIGIGGKPARLLFLAVEFLSSFPSSLFPFSVPKISIQSSILEVISYQITFSSIALLVVHSNAKRAAKAVDHLWISTNCTLVENQAKCLIL